MTVVIPEGNTTTGIKMGEKNGYKAASNGGEEEADSPRRSWFFNHIVFTIICCCSNLFYSAQLSYLGAAVSVIEKRFQMRSTQSSLFFTINDVVGLCSVIFITHFGQKGNRPRIIGCLYLLFGLGALVTTLPHFLYELPSSLRPGAIIGRNSSLGGNSGYVRREDRLMCNSLDGNANATCDAHHSRESGALIHEAWWIFLGQAMAGFISSSGPLLIIFLDDNQNKKNTPLFVGIIFSSWTIGIVLGFFLANFCLRLPATYPNIDPTTTVLDPRDSQFLGAWWLGQLICGLGIMITTIPILFFPRHFPGTEKKSGQNEPKVNSIGLRITGLGAAKGLFRALARIVTNVAIVAIVLASCANTNAFVGLRTFGTKYINTQFDIPVSRASLLTGVIIIPCAVFGNITGGYIIKRFRLQTRGMAIMAALLLSVICLTIPLYFFAGCPQNPKAGLTVPYDVHHDDMYLEESHLPDLASSCNAECNCPSAYLPVCGSDGLTYSTPCHAGCSEESLFSLDDKNGVNQTIYYNCSCLAATHDSPASNHAYPGECDRNCNVWFHLLIGLISSSVGSLAFNPVIMLQIRCVEDRDRSLVLGFTNVMVKLLGYIPGPVIWGALIDSACVLFQESCGKTGHCLVYDTDRFRNIYYGNVMVLKLVEIIFLLIALGAIIHGLKKAKKFKALLVDEKADKIDTGAKYQQDKLDYTPA